MFSEISWDGDSGGEGARFFYRFKGGRDQKSLRTTALYLCNTRHNKFLVTHTRHLDTYMMDENGWNKIWKHLPFI